MKCLGCVCIRNEENNLTIKVLWTHKRLSLCVVRWKEGKHWKRKARMDLPKEREEKSINDIHEQGGLRGHVREKEAINYILNGLFRHPNLVSFLIHLPHEIYVYKHTHSAHSRRSQTHQTIYTTRQLFLRASLIMIKKNRLINVLIIIIK